MAGDGVESITLNPTATYWLMIVAICVFFPPLLGFVLGVAFFCGIWWAWIKVLGT